ncbi:elongator complex protein 3 [Desulfopila sp. IMCC35008]|uniref:elongator complex protein 3 n=1 Tax=Desulfopila sp. IMCC35008 TaxID=2653858 RepID=UPI0013D7C863|nr:radical SAM protein [Desulfopila sp. IMCC35008]
MAVSGNLVIPIFISHRGCPHQCLFCNQFSITGQGPDQEHGTLSIAETVEEWLGDTIRNSVQVAFYGGSFTCLEDDEQVRLLMQVQPYLASGQIQSIRLSTRPDCVTRENAHLLWNLGVRTIELGVQSLDDSVLNASRRGHSADDSIRALTLLQEVGFETGVQLLPGLPGETTRSFLQGVKRVVELRPDMVRIYPAVVVQRSPLAEMFDRGEYKPLSLNRAIGLTRRARTIFEKAGVPVIRMGLQHSETLEKELVAGPYHPAFGELVVSRQWFVDVRKKLRELVDDEHLDIHICNRDQSAVVGMKKQNIHRLQALGFADRFTLIAEKDRARGVAHYVVSKSS